MWTETVSVAPLALVLPDGHTTTTHLVAVMVIAKPIAVPGALAADDAPVLIPHIADVLLYDQLTALNLVPLHDLHAFLYRGGIGKLNDTATLRLIILIDKQLDKLDVTHLIAKQIFHILPTILVRNVRYVHSVGGGLHAAALPTPVVAAVPARFGEPAGTVTPRTFSGPIFVINVTHSGRDSTIMLF